MARQNQDVARMRKQLAHPRDRKVRQLERKQARVDRASAQDQRRRQDRERLVARFLWFREQCVALGHTTTPVPAEWVVPLARVYIDRNAAETAALRAMRNPPQGRIRTLESLVEDEMAELRSAAGFTVPKMCDADEVEILTGLWDGLVETSVVLNTEGASIEGRRDLSPEEAAVRRDLEQRLAPVEEVRAAAAAVLPRSAQRFQKVGQAHLAKAAAAEKKKVTQKQSVKTLVAATGAEARQRVRATAHRKQQTNLKKMRQAALDARRHSDEEADEAK